MTEEEHNQDLRNPEIATDQSEINVKAILLFGVLLVLACLVSLAILAGFFSFLHQREVRNDRPLSPLVSAGERRLPPEPRLQLAPGHEKHPLKDLADFRREEEALATNFGWISPQAGVVRIPIAEAKRLLLARGLPARPYSGQEGMVHGFQEVPQPPSVSSAGRR
jgi:hypothetical protein